MRKVGILTGGGDCPGLNAVIRAVVRRAEHHQLRDRRHPRRLEGALEPEGRSLPSTATTPPGSCISAAPSWAPAAPTPSRSRRGRRRCSRTWRRWGWTRSSRWAARTPSGAAKKLGELGLKVVGVPKTIDNDLNGTDFTFGFDTAVSIATEAIDRLHSTAESHQRVMVCEVMGRHAGWIATYSGLAGGADAILIPEIAIDLDKLCEHVKRRTAAKRHFSIIVVAEGAKFAAEPEGGRRSTSSATCSWVASATTWRRRSRSAPATRRASPCSATSSAAAAPRRTTACSPPASASSPATWWPAGKFGQMAGLRGNEIQAVPLAEAVKELKTVDRKLFELASTFFG